MHIIFVCSHACSIEPKRIQVATGKKTYTIMDAKELFALEIFGALDEAQAKVDRELLALEPVQCVSEMASTLKCVRVGTDCSGMEAPIQAMENLGVEFEHRFSCDIDKNVRATILANFPHGKMYEDVTTRCNTSAPHCDLYVAGFPCQPFSSAGLQNGFNDNSGRGTIFFFVREYIEKQRPRVFILENVTGLVKLNNGSYFATILKSLEQLGGYNISHQILDTKQNGVPHSRRRVYIVGIHQDADRGTFTFPEPIPAPSMNLFLDSRPNKAIVAAGLPPKTQTMARSNVVTILCKLKREGRDPLEEPFLIDCDSSTARSKSMFNVSPCITCGRHMGHWVTNRGRRLRKMEMMRLQGMDPTKFRVVVSEAQLGKQLGNTMSVNVLERLLVRLLPAAGLASTGLRDRWADGSAVRRLATTRDHGFAESSAQLMMRRKAYAAAPTTPNILPKKLTNNVAKSLPKKRWASSAATAKGSPKRVCPTSQ